MGGIATQPIDSTVFFPTRRPPPAVESWTLTGDQVDQWLKRARPGEVLVYAHGPSLIQGAAAARIRALIKSDDVIPLPQRRSADGGFDYRVVRNRVRTVRNAPVRLDAGMRGVLDLLTEAAAQGRRCPSDADMGARLGGTPDQVKWAVRRLVAGKWIETRIVGTPRNSKFRVVRILSTGAETALPGPQE